MGWRGWHRGSPGQSARVSMQSNNDDTASFGPRPDAPCARACGRGRLRVARDPPPRQECRDGGERGPPHADAGEAAAAPSTRRPRGLRRPHLIQPAGPAAAPARRDATGASLKCLRLYHVWILVRSRPRRRDGTGPWSEARRFDSNAQNCHSHRVALPWAAGPPPPCSPCRLPKMSAVDVGLVLAPTI